MLHSHNHIQPYPYTWGSKINNNDERTHFFRKIYLLHFIRNGCERVMCERWVGDWTNCNILTPSSFVFSSTSFSFYWAAQPGALRANSPLLGLVLSTTSYLQLTWTPTNSKLTQGYILMSSTGCTCFSIDGWAKGQYVTDIVDRKSEDRILPTIGWLALDDIRSR